MDWRVPSKFEGQIRSIPKTIIPENDKRREADNLSETLRFRILGRRVHNISPLRSKRFLRRLNQDNSYHLRAIPRSRSNVIFAISRERERVRHPSQNVISGTRSRRYRKRTHQNRQKKRRLGLPTKLPSRNIMDDRTGENPRKLGRSWHTCRLQTVVDLDANQTIPSSGVTERNQTYQWTSERVESQYEQNLQRNRREIVWGLHQTIWI